MTFIGWADAQLSRENCLDHRGAAPNPRPNPRLPDPARRGRLPAPEPATNEPTSDIRTRRSHDPGAAADDQTRIGKIAVSELCASPPSLSAGQTRMINGRRRSCVLLSWPRRMLGTLVPIGLPDDSGISRVSTVGIALAGSETALQVEFERIEHAVSGAGLDE